jgi:hypothetical protein
MTIDFYEAGRLALSLDERVFGRLQDTLELLLQRTGRTVDPYGSTNLPPEHAGLWLEALRRRVDLEKDPVTKSACQQLIALLRSAEQHLVTLSIEGD